MKMTPELAGITNKIVARNCDSNQPIILFAADMLFTINNGKADGVAGPSISFYNDPYLFVSVEYGAKTKEVCLGGYNYPYQVKMLMDAIAEVGYFE